MEGESRFDGANECCHFVRASQAVEEMKWMEVSGPKCREMPSVLWWRRLPILFSWLES